MKLNVAEAQATVESDRIKILNDIKASTGIEAMNQSIRKALVRAYWRWQGKGAGGKGMGIGLDVLGGCSTAAYVAPLLGSFLST